jgi:hypothetical protein
MEQVEKLLYHNIIDPNERMECYWVEECGKYECLGHTEEDLKKEQRRLS